MFILAGTEFYGSSDSAPVPPPVFPGLDAVEAMAIVNNPVPLLAPGLSHFVLYIFSTQ